MIFQLTFSNVSDGLGRTLQLEADDVRYDIPHAFRFVTVAPLAGPYDNTVAHEERTVAIVGQEGRPTSIALSYRHFDTPTEHGAAPLKYTLDVDAGASMPTTLQARRQQTMMLYAQRLIDRAAALQELNIPNWEEIDDRMKQEEQSGSGLAPAGGRQSKKMGP